MPTLKKRKDSSTGIVTDDPTDNKSEGTESFLKPTKHDILPLILAIISVCMGLVAGLTAYFLLIRKDVEDAKRNLQVVGDTAATKLSNDVANALGIVETTQAFFQLSSTPILMNEQFVPFMTSQSRGLSFPKYLTNAGYSAVFPGTPAATSAFEASMRALGGLYENFTVTGRDSANKPIPPIDVDLRAVIVQVVPTASFKAIVGYDAATDPVKAYCINKAISSGKAATTGRTVTALLGPNGVAASVYTAIYNKTTNQATGAVSAVMAVSTLISESLTGVVPSNIIISLLDMNYTSDDAYKGFIYSTLQSTSYVDNNKQIASADYVSKSYLPFADRTFELILMPGPGYQNQFKSSGAIIAISLSLLLAFCLVVVCFFIYIIRKLMMYREARKASSVQIDLLKTNQTALRILLDRIAAQETKTRAVINSLPDFICVITVNGKILQTNSAFDDEFPFTQQEMEKGVHIWNIFTELASDFYRTIDEEEVATQASRRFGDVIDVSVRVRSLKEANEASSTQSQEKVTGLTSLNLQDAEEAYVVIAKNRSIKAVEVISEDRVRRSAFEKRFRDKGFQTDFKQFCEKNKTVENIMFLEAVAEYKKKSFGDRVDMKMHIFDQFIKEEARMQLNLDNATVVEETIKIGKSMGDIDVFKTVEDCVYKIIVNDIMPRYILEKQII